MSERCARRIAALRAEIDQTDIVLVDFLRRRAHLAREIGVLKREAGLDLDDPAREAAVLSRASLLATGVRLPAGDVRSVFHAVIALCRRAQGA
jgi:chorismate mutase / prephenate dehydratase